MENQKALMPVSPMRSPQSQICAITSDPGVADSKLLHSLNLKLQVKVISLENEVGRLKDEVQGFKGKKFIYESLTKDLSSLRTQLDKTALALLKKCDAYDSLKEELTNLKKQYKISPKSSHETIKKFNSPKQPPSGNVKRKLAIYQDIMDMSDTDSNSSRSSGRPSMGSCGNIVKEILTEEAMPSCLKVYEGSTAPLRNRVLMKLHTLKSASTESLESVGRKSIKAQEATAKTTKTTMNAQAQIKKSKPNLDSSIQFGKGVAIKAPPSIRPALGQNNGRVVRVNTALKKSNSSCSAKTRPAFRV